MFATETEELFKQWVKAFRSGATIEVQPVSNVEDMRITDLEMQRRWTNVDKDPYNEFEVREGAVQYNNVCQSLSQQFAVNRAYFCMPIVTVE